MSGNCSLCFFFPAHPERSEVESKDTLTLSLAADPPAIDPQETAPRRGETAALLVIVLQ